jgi:putative glutamine amidotransferase
MGPGYHRPVPRIVAVTCDRKAGTAAAGPNAAGRIRPGRALVFVQQSIVDALTRAGCEPLLIPPAERDPGELVEWLLGCVQGVVLTGGPHDLDPAHYGGVPLARMGRIDRGRDDLELALARAAWERRIPLLGVCGGMQAMAVAVGGTLVQDIHTQRPEALEHEQPTDPAEPWHDVALEDGRLRRAFGADRIRVNSTHHQAVDDPGPLRIVGRAPDGIVEAIESDDHPFFVGVEWHPELIDPTPYVALAAAMG